MTSSARLSILGVQNGGATLAFYQSLIGLRLEADTEWSGPAFEQYWRVPRGTTARAMLLSAKGRFSGRVLLLEFRNVPERRCVHAEGERWFTGYNNVNFYTLSIRQTARDLAAQGYRFWSSPLFYEIGSQEGAPTEVIFDGPDGIYVNLVEPQGAPDTRVGAIRKVLDERGCTETGYSEVVTSSLSVRSADEALAFFVDALGLEVWMDFEVSGAARNRFLALPAGCRSRNVFLVGDDLFGKIALFEPLNFSMPDRGREATPPHIGYLAMSFEVEDLGAVAAACDRRGYELFTKPVVAELAGLGQRYSMLVRAPSCAALVEVVQRL